MKTHKFLILHTDQGSTFYDNPMVDAIHKVIMNTWQDSLRVVTGPKENFHDNVITLVDDEGEDIEYFKDIDGDLWSFSDYLTRMQLINEME